MTAFLTILTQMMFLFTCILIGFILSKKQILPSSADVVLSRLLSMVCIPAMVIHSFRTHCTPQNLRTDAVPLLICVIITLVSIGIAFLLAPRFTSRKENLGVYRYAITLSNFGFVGNPLIQALLGDEALFHFLIFTLPGVLYAYTLGMVDLTAGKQKFTWKMLLSPTIIAMAAGIFMGLVNLPLPAFLEKAISSIQACYAPLGMIMTGFVIARFDLKELIRQKSIYAVSVLRLVIMPLVFLAVLKLLHVEHFTIQLTIFYTAMPLGLSPIIFPAAFGGDETPGAAMAIISNVIGLITVPLIVGLVL